MHKCSISSREWGREREKERLNRNDNHKWQLFSTFTSLVIVYAQRWNWNSSTVSTTTITIYTNTAISQESLNLWWKKNTWNQKPIFHSYNGSIAIQIRIYSFLSLFVCVCVFPFHPSHTKKTILFWFCNSQSGFHRVSHSGTSKS